MSDLDDIYPLGGLFGQTPKEPEFPDYLKCGIRYSPQEVLDGSIIVRHEGEFYKVDFEKFALRYIFDKLPVGSILDYVGLTPPKGWAICDGSSFVPTSYPELNVLLSGDTLPDFSGRATAYQGLHNTEEVGTNKGSAIKHIAVENLPPHIHSYIDSVRVSDGENDGEGGQPSTSPTVLVASSTTDQAGESAPMENVQPTVVFNKIIKAVPFGDVDLEFIPRSTENIVAETGLEIQQFCYRGSGGEFGEVPLEPYDPTYDLTGCVESIDLGISTVSGGLTSVTLTKTGDKYSGFAGQDNSVGGPYDIYIEIQEADNDKWVMLRNFDNINTDLFTNTSDFPACPELATWITPFVYESETYTIDYLIPTP